MRKAALKTETLRELESLAATFIRIRILHSAASEALESAVIANRLRQCGCVVSVTHLKQALATMTRKGWLKKTPAFADCASEASAYVLTAIGRRVLETSKRELKQLAATV